MAEEVAFILTIRFLVVNGLRDRIYMPARTPMSQREVIHIDIGRRGAMITARFAYGVTKTANPRVSRSCWTTL